MLKIIKAVFRGGIIRPLENIDLAEGQEVRVIVSEPAAPEESHRPEALKFRFDWAGGLKGAFGNLSAVDLQHKRLEWR